MGFSLQLVSENPVISQTKNKDGSPRTPSPLRILSLLSHDLKTPLASIIGSLEIFQKMRATLSEKKQETLCCVALEEARRLDQLITTVTELAKLDVGYRAVHSQACDVGEMIGAVLSSQSVSSPPAELELEHTKSPVIMITDAALFQQAIAALLAYAVKSASVHAAIRLAYQSSGDHVTITCAVPGSTVTQEKACAGAAGEIRLLSDEDLWRGMWLDLQLSRKIVGLLGGTLQCQEVQNGVAYVIVLSSAIPHGKNSQEEES